MMPFAQQSSSAWNDLSASITTPSRRSSSIIKPPEKRPRPPARICCCRRLGKRSIFDEKLHLTAAPAAIHRYGSVLSPYEPEPGLQDIEGRGRAALRFS